MSARLELPTTLNGETLTTTTQLECQAPQGKEVQLKRLLEQQDLLRDEVKHGKECLGRAQRELAESHSRLEEWPTYERQCAVNCLPHLTESVLVNRRIERFLTGWLRRRQGQLDDINQAIAIVAQETSMEPRQAEFAVGKTTWRFKQGPGQGIPRHRMCTFPD